MVLRLNKTVSRAVLLYCYLLDAVSLLEGWEMCPGLDRGTLPFRAAIKRFLNYSISHIGGREEEPFGAVT